jgi:hypothetical protein
MSHQSARFPSWKCRRSHSCFYFYGESEFIRTNFLKISMERVSLLILILCFLSSSTGMPTFDWGKSTTSVKTTAKNVIAALRLASVWMYQQRRECRASNENWDTSLAIKTGKKVSNVILTFLDPFNLCSGWEQQANVPCDNGRSCQIFGEMPPQLWASSTARAWYDDGEIEKHCQHSEREIFGPRKSAK